MTEAKKPSTTRKKAPPKPNQIWEGMTVKQFDAAKETFSNAATVLRLNEWHLKLNTFPTTDEDVWAEVHITYGQKRARVDITKEWNDLDAHTQRRIAFHELLHIYFDGITKHLDRVLPSLIGDPATSVVVDNVHEQIEKAVDAIAESFAQLKG